jgi:hypothetical protein
MTDRTGTAAPDDSRDRDEADVSNPEHTAGGPSEAMRRADRANGEPDALDGTTEAEPRDGQHPVGVDQAAENREVDPPA